MARPIRTEIFQIVGTMRGRISAQATAYRRSAHESYELIHHEGRRALIGWLSFRVKGFESRSTRMFGALRRPLQLATLWVGRLDRKVKEAERLRLADIRRTGRTPRRPDTA